MEPLRWNLAQAFSHLQPALELPCNCMSARLLSWYRYLGDAAAKFREVPSSKPVNATPWS